MKDYYQILEIPPNASQDTIKAQYRFLVQAWHPDKFRDSSQKSRAEEKLKEINEAYETLRNPGKRAEYDQGFRGRKASSTSNETVKEAERRANEERRRREEAESLRRKAEQQQAAAENRRRRAEQEKESFRRDFDEERQRREQAEQELNRLNSGQLTKVLFALFTFIFVTIFCANSLSLVRTRMFRTSPVLSPTDPANAQTTQQINDVSNPNSVTSSAPVTPIHQSSDADSSTNRGIIFQDDFQSSSRTSENWTSASGTWVLEDGVLSCIANGENYANTTLPENFTFQLDIMGINVIDKVIIFRAIGESTGYGIDYRTHPYNDIVLVKSVPGNEGQIVQTVPYENYNNTWYTIKIDVEDNHIRVFVNNQPTIDFIDTSNPISNGTVGLGAMLQPSFSVVYYDNIVVSHK